MRKAGDQSNYVTFYSRDVLTKPFIQPKNGLLEVPKLPGLGVDIDELVLKKYIIE